MKIWERIKGSILATFGVFCITIGVTEAFAPYPIIPYVDKMLLGAVLGMLGVNLMAYVFLFVWKEN